MIFPSLPPVRQAHRPKERFHLHEPDQMCIRDRSTYVPSVHIAFKEDIATRVGGNILTAARKAKNADKEFNSQLFREAFQGIYVKSDYGDGTVLYIDPVSYTHLDVYKRQASCLFYIMG